MSAFNFLLSEGEKLAQGTIYEVVFRLSRVISDAVQRRFITPSRNHTLDELEADVRGVSETAVLHSGQTRSAIEAYAHPLETFWRHYLDEVIAAEAMINSSSSMCVQGHINTKVLAELTGQGDLELIDPSTTVVNEIHYVQSDHFSYVNFEAVIDLSLIHI